MPASATFIILSGVKDVRESDLEFREYASFVEKALVQLGYSQSESIESADVAIVMFYSIGDPEQKAYSYSVPHFGQTGVISSASYGTISPTGYGNASYSGVTYNTPSYGVVGSSSHTRHYTTYTRRLRLEAINMSKYRDAKEIIPFWQINVVSTGSSGDLRRIIPIMVYASKNYFGKNTGEQILVRTSADDQGYKNFKSE